MPKKVSRLLHCCLRRAYVCTPPVTHTVCSCVCCNIRFASPWTCPRPVIFWNTHARMIPLHIIHHRVTSPSSQPLHIAAVKLAASGAAGEKFLRAVTASTVAGIERPAGQVSSGARLIKLESTNGAAFPQLPSGAHLFVRNFYEPCVKDVMKNLDPDCTATLRRFIILGNPGSE